MKVTKLDFHNFIFCPEKVEDSKLNLIPNIIGNQIGLRKKLIQDKDIQYYNNEIDWVSTINDLLVFGDIEFKNNLYDNYVNFFI